MMALRARNKKVTMKRLTRSKTNIKIAGVAGGIGEYFGVDPTFVRLIFVILAIPGGIPGVLLYLLCMLIIPKA